MAAQLKPDPINKDDITDYINSQSDFGFELKVLQLLNSLNFQCEHGGTYEDPVTGKFREFDIRALHIRGGKRLHFSIECKNFKQNFPLIVNCRARTQQESYQLTVRATEFFPSTASGDNKISYQKLDSLSCLYPVGEDVAKATDQIGRRKNGNELFSSDSEAFDKISQAIHSAYDLVSQTCLLPSSQRPSTTWICPVLVVPQSTLWKVSYNENGNTIGEPSQIGEISYYIGKEFAAVGTNGNPYRISHLEIVTYPALTGFFNRIIEHTNCWPTS